MERGKERHSRFLACDLALEETGGNINTYAYDMTGIHIANKANTVVIYIKDEHGIKHIDKLKNSVYNGNIKLKEEVVLWQALRIKKQI